LKGVLEEYIDTLNLMAAGDIYQKNFETICELCRTYSRSKGKAAKSLRELLNKNTKTSTSGGVTKVELGNLLENFKINLLGTIGSQLDTLNIKKKKEEENPVLSIFCSKCRKRHPLRECPLDNVSVCAICMENHKIEDCPSLPGLQAIFRGREKLLGLNLHLRSLGSLGIQMQMHIKNHPHNLPATIHPSLKTTTPMELAKLASTKCPCSALVPGMEKSKLWE
jgi:hypothetical protein